MISDKIPYTKNVWVGFKYSVKYAEHKEPIMPPIEYSAQLSPCKSYDPFSSSYLAWIIIKASTTTSKNAELSITISSITVINAGSGFVTEYTTIMNKKKACNPALSIT